MSAYVVSKSHIDALVRLALEGPQDGDKPCPGDFSRSPWSVSWGIYDDSAQWGYRRFQLVRFASLRAREGQRTPDEIGQVLIDENIRSIEARYPDTIGEPENRPGPIVRGYQSEYVYDHAVPRLTIAQGFSAIDCYVYQACETGRAFYQSEAFAFVDALRGSLCNVVPGSTDGAWDIDVEAFARLEAGGAGPALMTPVAR